MTETFQSPQLLSVFRGPCPICVHWHFSQLRTQGWDQREQLPVLLLPAPNGTADKVLGGISISRGARQCWAHREIRADGWRGWPGGWDNAGTYPASMQWEEMFPATATALSLAAVWEEVRAWPCVFSVFYKNISTLLKWKCYLAKSWKETPCLQRPSWPTHVRLCHTPLIPCPPSCSSIRSPVTISVW